MADIQHRGGFRLLKIVFYITIIIIVKVMRKRNFSTLVFATFAKLILRLINDTERPLATPTNETKQQSRETRENEMKPNYETKKGEYNNNNHNNKSFAQKEWNKNKLIQRKRATNEKNGKSVSDCMLMAERNGSEKEREREREWDANRKIVFCFAANYWLQ